MKWDILFIVSQSVNKQNTVEHEVKKFIQYSTMENVLGFIPDARLAIPTKLLNKRFHIV